MGLFDALFGNRNQIPTVTTILPDALQGRKLLQADFQF